MTKSEEIKRLEADMVSNKELREKFNKCPFVNDVRLEK